MILLSMYDSKVSHVGIIKVFRHAYEEGDFYCKAMGGCNKLTGSIVPWIGIWSRNSILDCICKLSSPTTFVIIETLQDWQSAKQTYGLVNQEVEWEIILMLQ